MHRQNEIKQLLQLISAGIWEQNPVKLWREIPEEEQIELIGFSQNFDYTKFLYYFLDKHLSRSLRYSCRLSFLASAGDNVKRQHTLTCLEKLFSTHNIDYFFLKGAYLANQCYPLAALRYSCDVDILLREEQLPEAKRLMLACGWSSLHEYANPDSQHLPPLHCLGFNNVELHHKIFGNIPRENQLLWEIIDKKDSLHELHFLHSLNHCLIHHDSSNGPKALIDIAYLLKSQKIDASKFQILAKTFHLEGLAELFLNSFEIIYPSHIREQFHAEVSPELCESMLTLFFEEMSICKPKKLTLKVANKSWCYQIKFYFERIAILSPGFIGNKYKIPPRQIKLKYLPFLAWDLILKAAIFCNCIKKNEHDKVFQKASTDIATFLAKAKTDKSQ